MSNERYCRQLLSILAVALALSAGFFCGNANAAPLGTATFSAFRAMAEPLGIGAAELKQGGLFDKWRSITQALPGEIEIIAQCRDDMDACPDEAKRFIAIIDRALAREGFAQIAEINRSINLNIRPVDDLTLYGVNEFWATPLTTFANGAGDCEDYAIAKYLALRLIGISADDVRLVVVYDRDTREHHAVASVRHSGRWFVLDNRTLAIQDDAQIAHFNPLFTLDGQAVKRIVAAPRKLEPDPIAVATIPAPAASIAPTTPYLL